MAFQSGQNCQQFSRLKTRFYGQKQCSDLANFLGQFFILFQQQYFMLNPIPSGWNFMVSHDFMVSLDLCQCTKGQPRLPAYLWCSFSSHSIRHLVCSWMLKSRGAILFVTGSHVGVSDWGVINKRSCSIL